MNTNKKKEIITLIEIGKLLQRFKFFYTRNLLSVETNFILELESIISAIHTEIIDLIYIKFDHDLGDDCFKEFIGTTTQNVVNITKEFKNFYNIFQTNCMHITLSDEKNDTLEKYSNFINLIDNFLIKGKIN